jgi:peptidoglycan-associated lipoprotein
MRFPKTAALALACALLAGGCSSTGKAKGEGAEGFDAVGGAELGKYGDGTGGAYGAGGTGGQGASASPDDPSGPLSKRIVYFQYDSSEVLPEYLPVVNSHAAYLAAHPGKSLTLEGHADERGSPEYNIALGEQRAKAVAKLMKLQGVRDGQLQIVSFGEEKPQAYGHDDSAWQQNRRVEIYYPGR